MPRVVLINDHLGRPVACGMWVSLDSCPTLIGLRLANTPHTKTCCCRWRRCCEQRHLVSRSSICQSLALCRNSRGRLGACGTSRARRHSRGKRKTQQAPLRVWQVRTFVDTSELGCRLGKPWACAQARYRSRCRLWVADQHASRPNPPRAKREPSGRQTVRIRRILSMLSRLRLQEAL